MLVIDTGTSGNAKKLLLISKIDHQASEVSTIFLTHYHIDHAANAKEHKDLTKVKVAVPLEDADFVVGKKPFPKPKNILFRAVSSFIKPTPVEVDVVLKDGDRIGNLTVISVPGHSL
jgi:glyoxylase-like metal-dependent hydrolase (beta-lactamase superfamily II)